MWNPTCTVTGSLVKHFCQWHQSEVVMTKRNLRYSFTDSIHLNSQNKVCIKNSSDKYKFPFLIVHLLQRYLLLLFMKVRHISVHLISKWTYCSKVCASFVGLRSSFTRRSSATLWNCSTDAAVSCAIVSTAFWWMSRALTTSSLLEDFWLAEQSSSQWCAMSHV